MKSTIPKPPDELLPAETIDPFLIELTDWMDSKFELPGLRWRFGLDALLGLIPGLGDVITFLISVYIFRVAARHDLPRIVRVRMALNVALDLVLGSIPILGDLLDVAWKANTRNLHLLRRTLQMPPASRVRTTRNDWLVVLGSSAALLITFTLLVVLTSIAVGWMLNQLRAV